MKQVQVKPVYGEVCEYLQIKTIEDVSEYMQQLGYDVSELVSKLLKSNVMPKDWDHIKMVGSKGGILAGAYMTASIKGTNPLFEIDSLIKMKMMNMIKEIVKGEIVLVNKNGGYCVYSPSYHTILSETEFDNSRDETFVIKENTRYINLENDPELERRSIEYLEQKDKNYSYVLNLRNYDVKALTDIFKAFVQNGGEVVYVYTTGLDVPQMFEYSEAIVAAKIKKVEFELNSGKNERHDEVIEYLRSHDVDVKLV